MTSERRMTHYTHDQVERAIEQLEGEHNYGFPEFWTYLNDAACPVETEETQWFMDDEFDIPLSPGPTERNKG